jgi:hypothetical protein
VRKRQDASTVAVNECIAHNVKSVCLKRFEGDRNRSQSSSGAPARPLDRNPRLLLVHDSNKDCGGAIQTRIGPFC